MMKVNIKYIILFFVVVYVIIGIKNSDWFNLKCVIADKNGKKYCVRDRDNINKAANLLASCVENMKKLVDHMDKKYPDDERVDRLVNAFNPNKISETLPNSEHTAYSENKGEKLAFCLNRKKSNKKLIDLNTLTFVAIHELSHIMTVSIGHKQEFWDNMAFLLKNAVEIQIYEPIDYENNPQPYCGDTITNNPYYDDDVNDE